MSAFLSIESGISALRVVREEFGKDGINLEVHPQVGLVGVQV
jgi:hypothetical protein